MDMGPRFVPYQDRPGWDTIRCWSVFEDDESDDGRLVCQGMIEADARKIARLLATDYEQTRGDV